MSHLTPDQVENYSEGQNRELDAHIAACARCQSELAVERRLGQALTRLERFSPSPEFAARLEHALGRAESTARPRATAPRPFSFSWIGVAALVASGLLLVFAYQTLVAFQEGGTLDFVALYFSRPDLLSTYPSESLSALIESLPLAEFTLTLGLLVIAVVLGQQFLNVRNSKPSSGPEMTGPVTR